MMRLLRVSVPSSSLGGPNGYVPVGLPAEDPAATTTTTGSSAEPANMKRARVLCSYDASGTNELNLTANEVSGRGWWGGSG